MFEHEELKPLYDQWAASCVEEVAAMGYVYPVLIIGLVAERCRPPVG
jgi:hypothetical protein